MLSDVFPRLFLNTRLARRHYRLMAVEAWVINYPHCLQPSAQGSPGAELNGLTLSPWPLPPMPLFQDTHAHWGGLGNEGPYWMFCGSA